MYEAGISAPVAGGGLQGGYSDLTFKLRAEMQKLTPRKKYYLGKNEN